MKHGSKRQLEGSVRAVTVSELKARLLEILNTLHRHGGELVVTQHGDPLARVVPIKERKPLRGMLEGQLEIVGDVVTLNCGAGWEANGAPSGPVSPVL